MRNGWAPTNGGGSLRRHDPPGRARAVHAAAGRNKAGANFDVRIGAFRVSLLILAVITISRVHSYFSLLGKARPAVLLVLFALAYAVLRPGRVEVVNLTRSKLMRFMGAFIVAACLSVPFGISMGRAGKFMLEDYWKDFLLFPLLLLTIRSATDLRRLVWAMVIASGILVWLSLFVFGISKSQGSYTYDANDIGCVLVTILPLVLLVIQGSGRLGRIAGIVILAGIGSTLAHSQSRGAFVGLVIVGIAFVATVRSVSVSKRLSLVALIAVALAFSANSTYWNLIQSLSHPTQGYNWDSQTGRRELAKRALGYMWQYPLFGIGIDNFPMAEVTISPLARKFINRTGEHLKPSVTHNTTLQVASEVGVTGLAVWIAMWFVGFASIVKVRKRIPRWWRATHGDRRFLYLATFYVPVAMVGYLVASSFVSFAYHDLTYVLLALVAALPVAVERELAAGGAQRVGSRAVRRKPVVAGSVPPGTSLSQVRPAEARQLP